MEKEIARLRAALTFLAADDCPPHGLEKNCVKNDLNCVDCLREFAQMALDGVENMAPVQPDEPEPAEYHPEDMPLSLREKRAADHGCDYREAGE